MSSIGAANYEAPLRTDPLTPKELETITRYLNDPSVFPREFKKWITDHASDTVDIARSQVHGLINSNGQIVPGVAETYFASYTTHYTMTSGHEDVIATATQVTCDGFPVEVEFFAPLGVYYDVLFFLRLDGISQGSIGRYTGVGQSGVMAQHPIRVSQRLRPATGKHDFQVTARSVGSGTTVISGGNTYASEFYGPGFFKVSKA